MKVWVILWHYPTQFSCGIGGVFENFEEAEDYLYKHLLEEGEVIEDKETWRTSTTYYTNYGTFSIEAHLIG